MSSRCFAVSLGALAMILLTAGHARGQLIVDRNGARDVLWSSDLKRLFPDDKGLPRLRLDSKKKSLALNYLSLNSSEFLNGNVLWGAQIKGTATDGLEQFFKFDRAPGVEVAGLLNWTGTGAHGESDSWWDKYFVPYANLRIAYKFQELKTIDVSRPVDDQLDDSAFHGMSSFLSVGALIRGRYGVALSAGYERASNYEDLPKVNVSEDARVIPLPGGGYRVVSSGGQIMRAGNLETFNNFPIDLTFAYHQGIKPSLVEWIPFVGKKYTFGLVFAPYGRFEPRDYSRPEHGIGLTVSLYTLTKLKERKADETGRKPEDWTGGGDVAGQKLSFPLSGYVEWKNAFREERTTEAGVAAVFKF